MNNQYSGEQVPASYNPAQQRKLSVLPHALGLIDRATPEEPLVGIYEDVPTVPTDIKPDVYPELGGLTVDEGNDEFSRRRRLALEAQNLAVPAEEAKERVRDVPKAA